MHPRTVDALAATVLLDIAVIVVVARAMGSIARRLRQPAVVGEIVAGIALGPSLLGRLPHDPSAALFPLSVKPYLNVVAQIGLVIFMFIVGLELQLQLVRGRQRIAAATSIAATAVPLAMGVGLAAVIHSQHHLGKAANFWPFALFVGASMSVTAFPVLVRIVSERGMQRTEVGSMAIVCAAIDDVLAWSLLAVVVGLVNASSSMSLVRIGAEGAAFALGMMFVVRPALCRLADSYRRIGHLTPGTFSLVMAGVFASAFITQAIGLHQIFGAFLFGAIMPRQHSGAMIREIVERLEQVTVLILLPVFFVVTGLGTNVTQLGRGGPLILVAVIVVAATGKFAGATGAARLTGWKGRKSLAIGILMNTRGLTELVILNVGLGLKVLDGSLFTVFVLMAVVTTIMTEPLLRWVYPERLIAADLLLGVGGEGATPPSVGSNAAQGRPGHQRTPHPDRDGELRSERSRS